MEEELRGIMHCWSRLQGYRADCLAMWHRADTQDVVLTTDEVACVKQEWQWYDLWEELTWEQQRYGTERLRSLCNSMLHKKAGWTVAADAIIMHRMPTPPELKPDGPAAEQAARIGEFALELIRWLRTFAATMVAKWKTDGYQQARVRSGHGPLRNQGYTRSRSPPPHEQRGG